MKHPAIKNRNNLSATELSIFGLSFVLGIGISIIFGFYSLLKFDVMGIIIFGVMFLFSWGVFFYVQDKTKGIEV